MSPRIQAVRGRVRGERADGRSRQSRLGVAEDGAAARAPLAGRDDDDDDERTEEEEQQKKRGQQAGPVRYELGWPTDGRLVPALECCCADFRLAELAWGVSFG